MKGNKKIIMLFVLVFILVVGQGFSIYLILEKSKQSLIAINETESRINEKINTEKADTEKKLSSLTEKISSLLSSQESLESQLAKLKATTSADFSGIIEQEIKGVVTIKTDISQGTGFFITDEGYIVTNAHILTGAHFANIYTYDNQKYRASLIGYDSEIDIALLKINNSFSKLNLGDSDNVRVGEKVIAIGNPLGLSFTATEGIISARDRTGSNNLDYYFQTDVSLNPGNSGGPLINTKGEVIGINNFKISGAENIGFALESNYIKETINDISLKEMNMTIL